MSDQRKEKLLNIQKREQLKGMLVNKFKLKYGDKAVNTINQEVGKFMSNRLTEENLKRLDDKIGRQIELKHHKDDVLSEHRSVKSGRSRSRPRTRSSVGRSKRSEAPSVHNDDAISVKSYASSRMSGATNLSKHSKAQQQVETRSNADDLDLLSQTSKAPSHLSNLNEEDEWTAIQNFNTLLHYEEQKQSAMREQERKRLIKQQLDKQVKEKGHRKRRVQEENAMYDDLQAKHIDLLDQKE